MVVYEREVQRGVLLFNKGEDNLFIKYAAVSPHSPQNWIGRLDWNCNALKIERRCWCFLSTTEFCCGVLTQLCWCTMPFEVKKKKLAC